MDTCSNCGSYVDRGREACASCGARIRPGTTTTQVGEPSDTAEDRASDYAVHLTTREVRRLVKRGSRTPPSRRASLTLIVLSTGVLVAAGAYLLSIVFAWWISAAVGFGATYLQAAIAAALIYLGVSGLRAGVQSREYLKALVSSSTALAWDIEAELRYNHHRLDRKRADALRSELRQRLAYLLCAGEKSTADFLIEALDQVASHTDWDTRDVQNVRAGLGDVQDVRDVPT